MQNGMHQRVNANAHKVVRINVKTSYGRIFVKKNRSCLFNSSFWRERVVLNDDSWEKKQKNFLRPVHNHKSSEKPYSDCGKSNFPIVVVQGPPSVYSALVVDCKIPAFVYVWKQLA